MIRLIYILMLFSFSITNPCIASSSKPDNHVVITSNVKGAEVFVAGKLQGKTPLSLSLSPRHTYRIIVQADGYGAQYVDLGSSTLGRFNCRSANYPYRGAAIGGGVGFIADVTCLGCLPIFTLFGSGVGILAGSAVGAAVFAYDNLLSSQDRQVHFILQHKQSY
jgi:hypothetical protein